MNEHEKVRVVVLAGARSTEHEVSLVSAYNIVQAIDRQKYEVYVVGISQEGVWRQYDTEHFIDNPGDVGSIKLADRPISGRLAVTQHSNAFYDVEHDGQVVFECDVIFPAVLGNYAEDGTMQGLLRMMDVPFTTADVLGSAVGMDKDVAYRLMRDAGLNVANFMTIRKNSTQPSFEEAVNQIGTDILFVKPSNAGSSVGVSKVSNVEEFAVALQLAYQYDTKVVLQAGVIGREVEVSVIGNIGAQESSAIGEIVEKEPGDFYSYENKYIHSDKVDLIAPADLPDNIADEVKQAAVTVCEVLECEGFGRVDFFIDADNKVYVNEINTMPGFTSISMFPRLWGVSGLDYPALVDRLLQIAIEKYNYRVAPLVLDAKEVLEIAKRSGAV
jgi:D-alanine-D-alanine ligase